MELDIYLWMEDLTVFIRELICFLKLKYPSNKILYKEKYFPLDNTSNRYIYLVDTGIEIVIMDYHDLDYLSEEYGTEVNINLWFNIITSMYDKSSVYIAEMVNWIMRTSDTDLAIEDGCSSLIFKREKGRIYYAQVNLVKENGYLYYDPFPIGILDFDREKAMEYTPDDKWVFCSEEHIQKMERWRKQQEKSEKAD